MRRALGRGLDALLPSGGKRSGDAGGGPGMAVAPSAAVEASPRAAVPGGATIVPVEAIAPNPAQPRRHFDEESLDSLAASIRRHGLLQPLLVRRLPHGYELIAGERRWRAAQRAGLTEVPVVVRDAEAPPQRLELALIENLQREDLTPLEEAEAYRQLMDLHGLTQDEIAQRVGKSRPAIANALRLLGLPETVKAQLARGELTAGHARAVLQLDGPQAQIDFAREIAVGRLPKREAERRAAARRQARGTGARATPAQGDVHWQALAEELTGALGTRVRVVPRAKGGTIEIDFYSLDQLDGLLARLRGGHPAPGPGVF